MTPSQSKSYEARVEEAGVKSVGRCEDYGVKEVSAAYVKGFKAGVAWANRNPAPHILELVAALKNIAETGVHEKMILSYEQERDLYQEMAREALRRWQQP